MFPSHDQVGGHIFSNSANIPSLPDNLKVGGSLHLFGTPISSIPYNLQVGFTLYLDNTPIAKTFTKEEIRKMVEDKGGYVKGKIYV